MNQNISELIAVSQLYGKDKSFVIAGGGNTSFKDEQHIWIKASGTSLETIDENGFVCLSREGLKRISTNSYSAQSAEREAEVKKDLAAAIVSQNGNRPSVETSMHEVIDYAFVVHTHPTLVNGLMCSSNAAAVCDQLFGNDALFIPYTDPGYVLFKKVEEEIKRYASKFGNAPQLIFLENHGVFVAANTVAEINVIYSSLLHKINLCIEYPLPSDLPTEIESPLLAHIQEVHPGYAHSVAKGMSSDLIQYFVKDIAFFDKVDTAFTPDDIVYCKAHYLFVPSQADEAQLLLVTRKMVADYFDQFGYLPRIIALEALGVIAVEDQMKSVLNMLEVFSNILKISYLSENFGGPKQMDDQQIDFIDNWEVENYRRQMAK